MNGGYAFGHVRCESSPPVQPYVRARAIHSDAGEKGSSRSNARGSFTFTKGPDARSPMIKSRTCPKSRSCAIGLAGVCSRTRLPDSVRGQGYHSDEGVARPGLVRIQIPAMRTLTFDIDSRIVHRQVPVAEPGA